MYQNSLSLFASLYTETIQFDALLGRIVGWTARIVKVSETGQKRQRHTALKTHDVSKQPTQRRYDSTHFSEIFVGRTTQLTTNTRDAMDGLYLSTAVMYQSSQYQ